MEKELNIYDGYPRSLAENAKYRAQLLILCEKDPKIAALVKEICRQDILFWIDNFCWTKDQRRPDDVLPFITYDYEQEYILTIQKAIRDGEDALTEKTRDMGVSWMVLYVFTHFWLFERGSDFRVGSRKEEYVDKLNDIDTLLEKVRFNLTRQPRFLLPEGFDPTDHAPYMRIINSENGNAIVGESANPYFGSGGRRKAILLDEFAKWDDSIAGAAWTATADVTKCRLVVSTPVGSGNKFAELALGTKEKIRRVTLHWTLHPEKSKGAYYFDGARKVEVTDPKEAFKLWKNGIRMRSPWYDMEAARRKESDLAQEVDIDYLKSGRPFFDIRALEKQTIWTYIERRGPFDPIPFGRHIRVNLVDVDNKVEIRERKDGWLRIFELPKTGAQYVVSADTAEGLAKNDEAFCTVRDKWTRAVVAASNGAYPPDEWALKLWYLERFYKAQNAPENNNHGFSVCSDLKALGSNLYMTKDKDGKATTKAGFTTDLRTRPLMLDQLEEEIRKSAVELRDEVLIAQCKTFVFNEKNGRPEADGNCLDDGVIACAVGSYVIKEDPFKAPPEADGRLTALAEEYRKPMCKF